MNIAFIFVILIQLFFSTDIGNNKAKSSNSVSNTTLIGAIMLSISLCFDGATGAYEDKLMGSDHVEPFDLMFNIQLGMYLYVFKYVWMQICVCVHMFLFIFVCTCPFLFAFIYVFFLWFILPISLYDVFIYCFLVGKAVISFCALVITNGLLDFIATITQGGIMLIVLGIAGAIGQVRNFYVGMQMLCRY